MVETGPSLDEWRRLYQVAIRLKELAPWEWMEEVDLFALQNPETGELGFVSIMGLLGEHHALALYLGAEGLHRFWLLQQSEGPAIPEDLLEMPHLQASFEDRGELTDEDRAVIKELGLKFRGRHAWPMFRSYRPGYYPWYLEAAEARFLTHALEQAVDVARRHREDPAVLDTPGDHTYLLRLPQRENGALAWADQVTAAPPLVVKPLPIAMNLQWLAEVKRLPRRRQALEVDLFLAPMRIGEKGARPQMPYMLLAVDSVSGLVMGHDLLVAEPDLQSIWSRVPLSLVQQLGSMGFVPRQVRVSKPLVRDLLRPLAADLAFEVKVAARLPALDEAKASFLEFMAR